MSNSDAPTVEGTKTPTYNRLFNAPDADLTVRSSDGQLFRVHRRNLYEHTEGFPGEDITVNTDEEIVSLTESASTLELLFQFMYRQEQPDVRQLQSTELFDLAEAVEKYRVFPALQVCNMAMAAAVPVAPVTVLMYALRHNHPALCNAAASEVRGSGSVGIISLDEAFLGSWLAYCSVFKEALKNARQAPGLVVHKGGRKKCDTWKAFQLRMDGSIESLCRQDDIRFQETFAWLERLTDDCYQCYTRARQWRKVIVRSRREVQREFTSFL
ncbi:uncharacterized protein C8Q71DRAFT_754484 [Rhodofomes roseus]|uniref:BTB domain-containing protein n=1 Tax=Rhodofomes roseus TaxID=34475 RepID=A0ABQ8KIJ4_9APHY|nr:uncharacterized protein C8Q71DRAFT_754484 [Rhodofomes roseus]KAH9837786.1 hypothetical protein C8Q71DRAFT_754484 [Rhodofomes roseus]